MKTLFIATLTLLNISIYADADVKAECKLIIDETCGSKDLTACMKANLKNQDLEVCIGSLLGEKTGAPNIVKELQADKLFDKSKAPCFTAVAEKCGTLEVEECIETKGNLFTQGCRELYVEIKAQQERLGSIGGSCFGESLSTCQGKYDVPTNDYSEFMSAMRSVEFCSSLEVMKKKKCTDPIKASAKARADAAAAAAAAAAAP